MDHNDDNLSSDLRSVARDARADLRSSQRDDRANERDTRADIRSTERDDRSDARDTARHTLRDNEQASDRFGDLIGRHVGRIALVALVPILGWAFSLLLSMSTDVAVMKSQMDRVEMAVTTLASEMKTEAIENHVNRSRTEDAQRRLTLLEERLIKSKP